MFFTAIYVNTSVDADPYIPLMPYLHASSSTPTIFVCLSPRKLLRLYVLYLHSLLKNDPNPHSPKSGPIQLPLYIHPQNRCTGNYAALCLPPLPYGWSPPTTYLMSTPTPTPQRVGLSNYPCTPILKTGVQGITQPFTSLHSPMGGALLLPT